MKRILLFLLILIGSSVSAQNIIYENPDLPKPSTIFSTRYSSTTPFWIKIGKTKYYMVRNRDDGNYSYKDIVGCDRPKKQLFEPFYEMNSYADSKKLTSKELSLAQIRFVPLKINGKLEVNDKTNDFPLDDIAYIDMMTLGTYVGEFLRPYGRFTLYLKTENGSVKKYIGHVDYQHERYLERLF